MSFQVRTIPSRARLAMSSRENIMKEDRIAFDVQSDLGERCNSFSERGRYDNEWALNQIISFLQSRKDGFKREKLQQRLLRIL
jgi:hypothetical protein